MVTITSLTSLLFRRRGGDGGDDAGHDVGQHAEADVGGELAARPPREEAQDRHAHEHGNLGPRTGNHISQITYNAINL